jgi:hypothetical protein
VNIDLVDPETAGVHVVYARMYLSDPNAIGKKYKFHIMTERYEVICQREDGTNFIDDIDASLESHECGTLENFIDEVLKAKIKKVCVMSQQSKPDICIYDKILNWTPPN